MNRKHFIKTIISIQFVRSIICCSNSWSTLLNWSDSLMKCFSLKKKRKVAKNLCDIFFMLSYRNSCYYLSRINEISFSLNDKN